MRLNHVALTVQDVEAAAAFLVSHFDMRIEGRENPHMTHLADEAGTILSLFRAGLFGQGVSEPASTHIGFMVSSEAEVDRLHASLAAAGHPAPRPEHSHGYSFVTTAPGGFAVEVVC